MRVYVFAHTWLSPLQKGIQSAHAVAELVHQNNEYVNQWCEDHKTLIILEGGNSARMIYLTNLLFNSGEQYADFYEDEDSMEGMHTAVAVLAHDHHMESFDLVRAGFRSSFNEDDIWKHVYNGKLAS